MSSDQPSFDSGGMNPLLWQQQQQQLFQQQVMRQQQQHQQQQQQQVNSGNPHMNMSNINQQRMAQPIGQQMQFPGESPAGPSTFPSNTPQFMLKPNQAMAGMTPEQQQLFLRQQAAMYMAQQRHPTMPGQQQQQPQQQQVNIGHDLSVGGSTDSVGVQQNLLQQSRQQAGMQMRAAQPQQRPPSAASHQSHPTAYPGSPMMTPSPMYSQHPPDPSVQRAPSRNDVGSPATSIHSMSGRQNANASMINGSQHGSMPPPEQFQQTNVQPGFQATGSPFEQQDRKSHGMRQHSASSQGGTPVPGPIPQGLQQQTNGRSSQPAPAAPPQGFPFDPRLLGYIAMLRQPQGQQMLQQTPALYTAVQRAVDMMQSGQISQQTMQAMMLHNQSQLPVNQSGLPMPQGPARTTATPVAPYDQLAMSSAQAGPSRPPSQQASIPRTPVPVLSVKQEKKSSRTSSMSQDRKPLIEPSRVDYIAEGSNVANHPAPVNHDRSATSQVPPALPEMETWRKALFPDPSITHIESLPVDLIDETEDATFNGALPPMTEQEIIDVRRWLDFDIEYSRAAEIERKEIGMKLARWQESAVMQPSWWEIDSRTGRRLEGNKLNIIWPVEKKARREKNRKKGKTAPRFTKSQMKAAAAVEEKLVPVRLDIEHGEWKLRDTFVWNAADTVVTPEMFAETICEDLSLPTKDFIPRIAAAIRERLRDAELPVSSASIKQTTDGVSYEGADEEQLDWWRRHRATSMESNMDDQEDEKLVCEDGPWSIDYLQLLAEEHQPDFYDLRIRIQLDIISGTMNLIDSFEWDLRSGTSPEEFAEVYAADLGLNGEFKTAIAHDIREQVLVYLKSLLLVGYPFDGSLVGDPDLRSDFLPPLTEAVRKDEASINAYTPFLNAVTDNDLERLEREAEKERKKKRGTRGRRAMALPDREPLKTNRTRISFGVDEQGIPIPQPALPDEQVKRPVVMPTNSSRRAAAIAAQATISYMAIDQPEDVYLEPPAPPTSISRPNRLRDATASRNTPIPSDSDHAGHETPLKRKSSPKHELNQLPDMVNAKRQRMTDWHCSNCGMPSGVVAAKDPSWRPGVSTLCPDCIAYAAHDDSARTSAIAARNGNGEPDEDIKPHVSPSPALPDLAKDNSTSAPKSPPRSGETSRKDSPLPFQDVASPDSTMSSAPPSAPLAPTATTPQKEPAQLRDSSAEVVSKPVITPMLRTVSLQHKPPAWLQTILNEAHQAHPGEKYELVYKGAEPGEDEAAAWRIKCLDCTGKIYRIGPGQSLQNFDMHLKNKKHLERVASRHAGTS